MAFQSQNFLQKAWKGFKMIDWSFCIINLLLINSLRNKVIDLGEILKDLPLDYLVISKTRLNESFPNTQFKLNSYEVREKRERNKHGGWLIEFVRQGFICKRLKKYEPNCSESICSEFTISKKSGSVLVYIGLRQREILKHSLKKWMR